MNGIVEIYIEMGENGPGDNDIVMLSDVDEIPRRETVLALKACQVDPKEMDEGIVFIQKQVYFLR